MINILRTPLLLVALAAFLPAQFLGQPINPPGTSGAVVVVLQANPEPMVISANIPQKSIGKWDISGCVASNAPGVTIPVERIRMALAQVPFMTAANAALVLNYKVSKNWKQVAANVLGEASLALVPIGASGAFHLSVKAAGYLAAGHGLADYLQGRFEAAVPSVAPLTSDLITQSLSIPPGGCSTGGLFSALVHQPRPVSATITLQ